MDYKEVLMIVSIALQCGTLIIIFLNLIYFIKWKKMAKKSQNILTNRLNQIERELEYRTEVPIIQGEIYEIKPDDFPS